MATNPPRLTLRIAAYTAVGLLFAASAILWFVNDRATSEAERNAAERTHSLAGVLLRDRMRKDDFSRPVTGSRRRELDELFDSGLRIEGVVRMNLMAPSGLVTYSTQPALIGTSLDHERGHIEAALRGRAVRDVAEIDDGGRRVKVLETYLPVRLSGSAESVGVFELYQDYERRVAVHARKTVLAIGGFLLLALIVICAALAPIMRRVLATVEVRNRQLVEQAATLERSLAAERVALTDAMAARQELAVQNERLRELDRLKDEFLSLVSHELRTPLTSIRGYLDLVLEEEAGDLNGEQRRFLQAVERNSARLLRLVGDLLFVAQADAGRLTLDRAEVDVASLAADCVEAARPAADQKSIDLALAVSPVPGLIGDRGRLAQVLDNLVSNALKFTPEGGKVTVKATSSNGHALVEVTDTGIGIPTADQPRLFERFFRSASATDQAIPGTGLGLAIVKAIVEAHGGVIVVESREGRGTMFRVELPLDADAVPAETVEAAA